MGEQWPKHVRDTRRELRPLMQREKEIILSPVSLHICNNLFPNELVCFIPVFVLNVYK